MAQTRYTKKSILSMVNSHVDSSQLLEFLKGKAKDIELLHDDTLICELITAVLPKIIKDADDGRFYSSSSNDYEILTRRTIDSNMRNLETLVGIICPHPESFSNFDALKTSLNALFAKKNENSFSSAKYKTLYSAIMYVAKKLRAAISNGDQLDEVVKLFTGPDKLPFISEQERFWREEDARKAAEAAKAEALAQQKIAAERAMAEVKARQEAAAKAAAERALAEAKAKQEAVAKAAAERALAEAKAKQEAAAQAEEKARQEAAAKEITAIFKPDGAATRERMLQVPARTEAPKPGAQPSPPNSPAAEEAEEDMLLSPPSSPAVPTLFAQQIKRTAPEAVALPQARKYK